MDALEFLKHDHQAIRELLEQAESTKDGTKQKEIFQQAKTALEIHARNEEAIFHSSKAQPNNIPLESYDGDEQMKTLLYEIEDLVFKLNVFKNEVEQHADTEDGESVPQVRNLDEVGLEQLGIKAGIQVTIGRPFRIGKNKNTMTRAKHVLSEAEGT